LLETSLLFDLLSIHIVSLDSTLVYSTANHQYPFLTSGITKPFSESIFRNNEEMTALFHLAAALDAQTLSDKVCWKC